MANSDVQIIPFYAQPHVHTVINDDTFYDETVASPASDELPYSTCVVTGADSGIDNTFVRLTSAKTKEAIFGKGNFQKYGQASLQADVLFNGSTNVWFCRVLPDNATYANVVLLAHYRKGKILNDLGAETGLSRLEVKFSTAYATKPHVEKGALSDIDLEAFAQSLAENKLNAQTGYMTVPICYIRSVGRGKYGNNYSISITRDTDAEKEYEMKMYSFNLMNNTNVTRLTNQFVGSLYQTTRYNVSTLISDVLDQYATGSCPIYIKPFEDGFQTIYDCYKEVVSENLAYYQTAGASADELAALKTASAINEETFDPLFGIVMNSRTSELIPYYRNYTVQETPWKEPDYTVAAGEHGESTARPLSRDQWSGAFVGARVLVVADPLNNGRRWLYTIMAIDEETGNIEYDEGDPIDIDANQYDGIDITQTLGHRLDGGHDGDFQEITVNGETRAPSAAEMKLLLSREYVKAFRGQKDKKILSPARVDLDFIFDANYNMTSDETLNLDNTTIPLYYNSTILTDGDTQALAIVGNNSAVLDFTDINVKQAMFDLVQFRNKNGMEINPAQGAGCSLYLDCGIVGLKNLGVDYELRNIIDMFNDYESRSVSIDLGYYEIFDPVSRKRITVTVDYYIAQHIIPHIVKYGLNTPFVYNYATIRAIQRDNLLTTSGEMIRDTFRPDLDLIDWDVNEILFKSRINYWLTTNEGRVVQRACQNTRQLDASALLEENNVRVLNTLKKLLDKDCRGYLYAWNEPEVRKGFTQAQTERFKPWIGSMVQDLSIKFTANEWEQERMIMHCYVIVKFRDIIKRIILEINIQRPTYTSDSSDGGES